ncbi:MAG: PKD domain-containing protein, partial [Verrucomicrobia bacterium]|nr:PKD domain-containing protein [Verrucomicrobiota bacterium]
MIPAQAIPTDNIAQPPVFGLRPSAPKSAIESFKEWASSYAKADAPHRAGLLKEGKEMAAARRIEMQELMEKNPKQFLDKALPFELRESLPAEIASEVEQPQNGLGHFKTSFGVQDPEGPVRFLRPVEINGQLYAATFAGVPNLPARGLSTPMNGVALGGHVVLSSDPVRLISSAEAASLKAQDKLPANPTCVSSGEPVANPAGWAEVGGKYYALCGAADAATLSQQVQAASSASVQLAGFDPGDPSLPPVPKVRQSKGQFRVLVARFRFPEDPSMPLETMDTTQFSDRAASILRDWSYGNCDVVPIVTPVLTLSQARQWYTEWSRGNDNAFFFGGFFGFFNTNQPPGRFESLRLDAERALGLSGFDMDSYDHVQAVFPPIPASNSDRNPFQQDPGSWATSTGKVQGIFADNVYIGTTSAPPTTAQIDRAYGNNIHAMLNTLGVALGIQGATLCDTRSPFRDQYPAIPFNLRPPTPAHILETEWWYGQEGYNRSGIYANAAAATAFERGGDPFDVMGAWVYSLEQQHYSVVHKMILGWLPTNYARVVNESTTNRLYAFDIPTLSPGNIYALGVRKDVLRTNWLEYRRRITDNPWVARGVLMHWGPWDGANALSQLIDSTPGSKAANDGFEDAAVVLGRTFSDTVSGVHITPTARGVDGTGEWIDVVVQKGDFAGNHAPSFDLVVSGLNVQSNQVVTFTASNVFDADGDQVAYFWDFGDKTFGENASEVKKAFLPGQYVVRCEVSDMKGGMTSTHVVITVDGVSTTHVHGRVVSLDLKPLANVRVAAIGNSDAVGFTDSDGLYDIVSIPTGTVTNIAHLYGYRILPQNFKNDSPLQDNASAELNYLALPKPTVSVEAGEDLDVVSHASSTFRFTRTGNLSQPLLVKYRVDGDAGTNVDFTGLVTPTNQVYFGVNVGQVDVPVQALPNPLGGGERSIFVSLTLETNQVTFTNAVLADGSVVSVGRNDRVPFWYDEIVFPGNPGTWGWLQTDSPYLVGRGEGRMKIRDSSPEGRPLVSLKAISDQANENGYDAAQVIFGVDHPVTHDLHVRYSLTGKAKFGIDFAPVSGEVTIPAGTPAAVLPIFAVPNHLIEGTRDLTITISDGPDFDVGVSRATVYILDDDLPEVRVSATVDTIFESSLNSGLFRIERAGDLSEPLAVDYVFSGTATNGVDFQSVSGTVVIPAGSDRDFVEIRPIPDGTKNLAKTVTLQLSSSPRYNAGVRPSQTITILDDTSPTVGLLPPADGVLSAQEGANGLNFQVFRAGPTNDTLFVNYEVGGTAENGADYRSIGTTVVIPAGQRVVTIPIVPIADRVNEWRETVTIRLLPSATYQIDPRFPQVTGTILDIDGQSLLASVGFELESSVVHESEKLLTIGVHLTGAPQVQNTPLVVEYRVVSGSAVLGRDYDFLSNDRDGATGWLRYAFFAMPETIATIDLTRNINIVLKDNPQREPTRDFVIELVYPQLVNGTNSPIFSVPGIQATNYILTTRRFHWVTILDDDAFQVSIEAVKPLAYERGIQPGAFRIFRTGSTNMEAPLVVRFDVSGTASEGADYKPLPRSVTIPARAADIIVPVEPVDDLVYEGPETVVMTLVNADGSKIGANNTASVTIVDDDGTMEFTAREYHVSEAAGAASIPVRRVGDASLSQFVKYSIRPGTATFDLDYFATDGRLEFAPGETLKTIDFLVFNDNIPELPETIELTLGDPSGGVSLAGQNRATVIIDNDDTGFVFTTNQWSVAEYAGQVEISIQRVGNTDGDASVLLSTTIGAGDLATPGKDFEPINTRVLFGDGEALKTILVKPIEDQLVEGDESLTLALSDPVGGDVSPETSTAKVIIRDDDCSVDFSVAGYQVLEHRKLVTLSMRRLGGTLNTVSVDFKTFNGSALAGKDYIATNGSVVFVGEQLVHQTNGAGGFIVIPGQTNATIDILIVDDTIGESPETFTVALSNIQTLSPGRSAQAAALGTNAVATVTILDNELPGHIDNEYGPHLAFTQREGDTNFASAAVNAIVTLPNGRAIIGGEFTEINDYTFRRIARLTLEGDLDLGFNPGVGADGIVHAMGATDDGRIFVAGAFKQVQGQDRPGIALISQDGDLETPFDPGIGSEGVPVRAIGVQSDGYVVVGGDFTRFDGQTRLRIARLDPKGFIDPTFGPSLDGSVSAIAIQPDGKILVGGTFSNLNATPFSSLARLNPDGTVDPTFTPGKGVKGTTLALAIQPDGMILVGGRFTAFDTVAVTNLVRLNPDGTFDPTFNQGSGPNDVVRALGVHRLGKIYVGGSFTSFNGQPRNRFLRLRSDGSLDNQFDIGSCADATVRALNVAASSAVYIGGEFSTIDGEARPRFARIHGDEKLSLVGVEFVNSSVTVSEDVGSVTLTVRRVGDPAFPFTVDFHTVPSQTTATAGSDYVATNGTFTFGAGVLTRSFKVQILDDLVGEPTETIAFVLDNAPFGVDLGGGVTSVIRILDNEATV